MSLKKTMMALNNDHAYSLVTLPGIKTTQCAEAADEALSAVFGTKRVRPNYYPDMGVMEGRSILGMLTPNRLMRALESSPEWKKRIVSKEVSKKYPFALKVIKLPPLAR